ncbi:RNA polymerase sigma-70 factor (ECF subfamily) [Haloferula luteola]|uniref:RNA polymerase sigma-70 factor (ECF subfamily) n=1 Tax=Haloferula luteola TaxID=595692 RepID=A0A840VIC9_9BACT|nr:sigma-70 family RNA polymerase sigma factor [Haloferula luteola]MBB5352461.1 RNA polymerase sigma-70 factor (ECF subfamily) [Haloferula luteola]
MARPHSPEASDQGEFVRLLLQHQDALLVFICHLVPNRDVRDDVLQEVNLLLWEKREEFELGTNFRAWAYAFARYVAMRSRTKAIREGKVAFGHELIETLADEFEEEDPLLAEGMPALRECLERLTEEDRALLLMRYRKHGAVEQFAESTGKSSAAVRGVLFRLRIALRRCVERGMNPSFPLG